MYKDILIYEKKNFFSYIIYQFEKRRRWVVWAWEVGGQQTFAISGDLMSTFDNSVPKPRDRTKLP